LSSKSHVGFNIFLIITFKEDLWNLKSTWKTYIICNLILQR
jgi:hypothetical protein